YWINDLFARTRQHHRHDSAKRLATAARPVLAPHIGSTSVNDSIHSSRKSTVPEIPMRKKLADDGPEFWHVHNGMSEE
ncbi:hypothetical protein BGZ83_002121, partial [Gryganskiella cystojenkinii]